MLKPITTKRMAWCAGVAFVLTVASVQAGETSENGPCTKQSHRRSASDTKEVLMTLTRSDPVIYGCGRIDQSNNQHVHTSDRGGNAFIYGKDDIRLRSSLSVGDSLRFVPGVTVRGMR